MERNVDLSFTARKEKGESNYHGYRVHVNRGIKYQKRRRKKKKEGATELFRSSDDRDACTCFTF